MTDHAVYAPSKMARILACPASVRLEQGLPNISSVYAEEGTRAHALAERALRGKPIDWPDVETRDAVMVYCNYVKELKVDWSGIEQRVTLFDNCWGTADFLGFSRKERRLYVVDYKHGAGVAVSPENNAQALTYAAGALFGHPEIDQREVDEVVIVIVQPRAPGEAIKEWRVETDVLLDHMMSIIEAAGLVDTDPTPGEHCKFCLALRTCPASQAAVDYALATEPSRQAAALADQLRIASRLKEWIRVVEATAFDAAESGEQLPGWKLVDKRATRRWLDEAAAARTLEMLGVDCYDTKLRSPAQIEKAGIDVSDLCTAESSGHTLVPDTDERPGVTVGGVTETPEFFT
jgi:hypothetical protein